MKENNNKTAQCATEKLNDLSSATVAASEDLRDSENNQTTPRLETAKAATVGSSDLVRFSAFDPPSHSSSIDWRNEGRQWLVAFNCFGFTLLGLGFVGWLVWLCFFRG